MTSYRSPWLFPEEHALVVAELLDLGLLKFDNNCNLPLKSGGTTDVYINLREARQNPKAISFLTDLFERPLRMLDCDSFVEVPDSVSCIAGPLSLSLDRPYVTIRKSEKAGRVADAKMIGSLSRGDSVCIIDDVITNGESKVAPIRLCQQLGVYPEALVVLVDRQQGWQEDFSQLGITTPVWPGITLHDVRRELIRLQVMQRCDPEQEERNRIIVALDGKRWDDLLPLLERLRTTGAILKVNDLVFSDGISNLLPELQTYGRVMVDLKCHDIPNTVRNTCAHLYQHNPWAVTVHASGSGKMIKAAVDELQGSDTKVLAVTVLTSIDEEICKEIYGRRPWSQVKKLAEIAWSAGAHGFVCSTHEVRQLRKLYPDATLVVPGVRSPGKDTHDQQRVGTPARASEDGADYLVMGRQILGSPDPVAEVDFVLDEIFSAPMRESTL